MRGNLPTPHVVTEGNSAFVVHVAKGQNHGLFLDMANGRQWLRENMMAKPGARVLNLFAYTCAFSVVAKQAGAAEVINLDMSDGAVLFADRRNQRVQIERTFGNPVICHRYVNHVARTSARHVTGHALLT